MSLNMRDNHAKAPPEAKRVVDFLRNKAQLKTRTGALNGKRVDYFKGKSAIKALRSPAYAKLGPKVPQVADDDAAQQLLHSLIPHTFFLRIQRGPTISSGVKAVQIVPQQLFAPDEHYVWLVDPNPIRQLALAVGMVAVVLAGVMFPLWPVKMRIGVWYLSVAVLGLIAAFFGLAIVRLVLWLVTKVVARPGIWLFPNLFADVGFVDSFIPTWGWDVPPPKKSKKAKDGVAAGAGGGDGDKRSKKGSSSKRRDAAAQAQAQARAPLEAGEGARITELVEGDEDEDDE